MTLVCHSAPIRHEAWDVALVALGAALQPLIRLRSLKLGKLHVSPAELPKVRLLPSHLCTPEHEARCCSVMVTLLSPVVLSGIAVTSPRC